MGAEDRASAYHEAGHAVAAVKLGLLVRAVSLVPPSCELAPDPPWRPTKPAALSAWALAGDVAEARSVGRSPDGSFVSPEDRRHVTGSLADELLARREAEAILAAGWASVQRVARELLVHGRLNGDQVGRLVRGEPLRREETVMRRYRIDPGTRETPPFQIEAGSVEEAAQAAARRLFGPGAVATRLGNRRGERGPFSAAVAGQHAGAAFRVDLGPAPRARCRRCGRDQDLRAGEELQDCPACRTARVTSIRAAARFQPPCCVTCATPLPQGVRRKWDKTGRVYCLGCAA